MSMLGLGLSLVKQTAARVLGFVRDGLKAYYRFYETTPDFLLEGSTYFTTNDYIDCGGDTSLDTTSAITLSCWIKPAVIDQTGYIVARDDGTNRNFLLFLHTDEKIYFDIVQSDSGVGTVSGSTVVAGTWYHLTATYDGVRQKLYFNGVLEDDDAETGAIDNDDVSLEIGRKGDSSNYFNGSIANVGIWNRALSASEVESIRWRGSYSELQDTELTNLLSWWDLQGDVNDKHGSNNGTNNGATLNSNSYSGTSPFKPRIRDKAQPKMAVQLADGSTSFDGSNYIDTGTGIDLGSTTDFTISFWAKTDDWTSEWVMGKWEDDNNRWYIRGESNDYLQFYSVGGGSVGINYTGTTALTSHQGKWVHCAIVADRSANTKGYINGSLDDTDTTDDPNLDIDTDANLSIGAYLETGDIKYFTGSIANVSIHSSALTQAQIQELMFTEKYAGLSSGLKTNLVSWYDLGDTSLGSEMVTNGDVETGDLTGWGAVNSGTSVVQSANSTSPISGTYDSKTVITGNDSSHPRIHVTMSALTAGKTYRVSYKAKASEATTPNYVSLRVGLASTELALTINALTTSTQTFTQDVVATGAHTRFIWYASNDDGTTIYMDDVSIKEVLATDSQGSNEGSIYGATTNTGYTSSPHGVVDPLNLGSVYSGTAVSFDGTNDYVGIPSSSAIEIAGDISISCWVNADNFTDGAGIVVKRAASGISGIYQLDHNTSGAVRIFTGGDTVTATTTLSTGQWYHIVATVDSGVTDGTKFYINGVQDATTGTCTVASSSSHNLRIGSNEADAGVAAGFFGGDISSVKIFNLVLTEAQVQEMYLNPEQILPTGVASSNLKLYLPMQEGVGSYAYDGSGNQNHGTLTGATWSTANNQGYQSALVRSNKPMIFDGTGDYVSIADTNHLSFGNSTTDSPFTISVWSYNPSLQSQFFVTKDDYSTNANREYVFVTDSNYKIKFRLTDQSTGGYIQQYGDASLSGSAGQWNHFVATYSGNSSHTGIVTYLNGSVIATTGSESSYTAMENLGKAVEIGGQSTDGQMTGIINEVAIWDTALTASEVTALYGSGTTPLLPTVDSGNYASTDGLQGYWRNDNVTTWTDRANTGVASFDGTGDYLSVANDSIWNFGTSDWSVSSWVKLTSNQSNYGGIVSAKDASDGWLIYFSSANIVSLNLDGAVILSASGSLSLNRWYHIICTKVSSTISVYIDGSLNNTATNSGTYDSSGGGLEIGRNIIGTDNYYFIGQISGTHIFNTALSASEVTELYALDKRASISGHSKFSNCVGSWLMGAGSGDTTSTLQDQTSENNDATVTNATLVGYNDGTASGSPADILLPEGNTAGRDTQGFLLTDTTSISNGIRLHGNEYISIDDTEALSFGDGTDDRPFSVEAWIKMKDATSFTIASKGVYNSTAEWIFFTQSAKKLYLNLYDETESSTFEQAYTTADLEDYEDIWTHVCATYNGVAGASANAGIKIYINSVAQSLTLNDGGTYVAMENLAHDVWIGRYDSNYAKGQIDEVRVYSKELSATEITTNYNNGKSAHP